LALLVLLAACSTPASTTVGLIADGHALGERGCQPDRVERLSHPVYDVERLLERHLFVRLSQQCAAAARVTGEWLRSGGPLHIGAEDRLYRLQ